MSLQLVLPSSEGALIPYSLVGSSPYPTSAPPARSRVCFAAVHVVAEPLSAHAGAQPAELDWDATLRFRHHIWDLGLGVAEAMDTAQRGMGLDWATAAELIRRTAAEARGRRALVCAGAQTDHLVPGSASSLEDVVRAYLDQCMSVESSGAVVAVMASRELSRLAKGPDDYAFVYGEVLANLERPAILHWLGEAFDPALSGYWGGDDFESSAAAFLDIVKANAAKVDGVKCSLLDQAKEVELRRQLPPGVRMYTGDDFDYPTVMAGDGSHHSDALLGAFDFAAPAAAWSLAALDDGDPAAFRERLDPTVPLSRHVFSAPTWCYKTGVVFLAYLNGFQSHFRMVGGLESARSLTHLAQCFRLADRAGLLVDPELATARMRDLLALGGVR